MEKKLNILMCCYLPLNETLGGAKGYLDVAKNYRRLGHHVDLLGIDEIVGPEKPYEDEEWRILNAPHKIREYLLKNSDRYDVIEYESLYLPFDLKPEVKALLVARCSLLDLNFNYISIPRFSGIRSLLGFFLKNKKRKEKIQKKILQAMQTFKFSDLINVQNPNDCDLLFQNGIPKEKIIIQPLAIFKKKMDLFESEKKINHIKSKRKIAFVGTFDNRKGAVEFPTIIERILTKFPDVEFKLIGVLGMFATEEKVIKYLGVKYKKNITVVGKFSPEKLPALLSDCLIGLFPSYLESFGYGALEMMAMDLPVVGYNSPGINMFLLSELMHPRGDVEGIIFSLEKLLSDEKFQKDCISKCRKNVEPFIFENQKNKSIEKYQELVGKREKI